LLGAVRERDANYNENAHGENLSENPCSENNHDEKYSKQVRGAEGGMMGAE